MIDADVLKARIMEDVPGFLDGGSSITKAFILAMLETRNATPTIDAVPVVRCKDCKNWAGNGAVIDELPHWLPCKGEMRQPDWFCSDGERQEGRLSK